MALETAFSFMKFLFLFLLLCSCSLGRAATEVFPDSWWTSNIQTETAASAVHNLGTFGASQMSDDSGNPAWPQGIEGFQIVPYKPEGFVCDWNTSEGSTILGELKAIRLQVTSASRALAQGLLMCFGALLSLCFLRKFPV